MLKEKWSIKLTAVILAGTMAAGLAGCGEVSPDDKDVSETESSVYTYEPEYWNWTEDSDTYIENLSTAENTLIFSDSRDCCQYLDLGSKDAQPAVLYDGSGGKDSEEGFDNCVDQVLSDGEGSIIVITRKKPSIDEENAAEEGWIRQWRESTYSMKKVAKDKTVVFEKDITRYVFADPDVPWLADALADGEGNIYLSNGVSYVWIFDKEGGHLNDVRLKENLSIREYIKPGVLGAGRIAVATDANEGRDMNLVAYDVRKKDFTDVYDGLPSNCWGTSITPGPNGGVLLNGNGVLYEYDLENRTYSELMSWEDYEINAEYIRFTSALENGNIAAYYDDRNGDRKLILLKRTERLERPEDETRAVLTLPSPDTT